MTENNKDHLAWPTKPLHYARLFFTGFAMGSADIVPGVSGGTMAFILGVYETLINAIKSFDAHVIKLLLGFKIKETLEYVPWRFLVALGAGILAAVFSLSRLLSNLLENQPTYIFAFFGGLIIASVVAIGLKVKWSLGAVVALISGAMAAFVIVGLPAFENVSHDPLTLVFSGMLAIMAMILPGISGSFILLILGQYEHVLGAVKNLDIVSIASVGVGAAIGIIAFSRILSWLLKHYYNTTVAVLVGFMLGSLRKIWDEAVTGTEKLERFGGGEIVIVIVLVIVGFLLVSLLDHLQTGENPVFRRFWNRKRDAEVATA